MQRQSNADRFNAIMKVLESYVAQGETKQQAIEHLTDKQFDFLVDYGYDTDQWTCTPQEIANAKEVRKQQRTRSLSPNGYNKIYPQAKMDLFNAISQFLIESGATIQPKEKENYRDLDFMLNNVHYKIVLSNPRK